MKLILAISILFLAACSKAVKIKPVPEVKYFSDDIPADGHNIGSQLDKARDSDYQYVVYSTCPNQNDFYLWFGNSTIK